MFKKHAGIVGSMNVGSMIVRSRSAIDITLVWILGLGSVLLLGFNGPMAGISDAVSEDTLSAYTETIPDHLVTFDMVPVAANTVSLQLGESTESVAVDAFWISSTEVTWDLYDIFAYQLDLEESERLKNADAVSRPSRPYQSPDYGYGHQGYAAICVTYHAAEKFTEWLSEKTGKTYRLATDAEWQLAAQGGASVLEVMDDETLAAYAWTRENADDKTQAVASKKPNAAGVYDMLGNVREWVTGHNGEPMTRGGSFKDAAEKVSVHARAKQHWKWNETDPQIPKSKWWLSDGYHVGFRIVRQP